MPSRDPPSSPTPATLRQTRLFTAVAPQSRRPAPAPFAPVVALRSSKQKSSPLDASAPALPTAAEIAELERKVQMLKQALKISKLEGRRDEDHQIEMVARWKHAGREV